MTRRLATTVLLATLASAGAPSPSSALPATEGYKCEMCYDRGIPAFGRKCEIVDGRCSDYELNGQRNTECTDLGPTNTGSMYIASPFWYLDGAPVVLEFEGDPATWFGAITLTGRAIVVEPAVDEPEGYVKLPLPVVPNQSFGARAATMSEPGESIDHGWSLEPLPPSDPCPADAGDFCVNYTYLTTTLDDVLDDQVVVVDADTLVFAPLPALVPALAKPLLALTALLLAAGAVLVLRGRSRRLP